MTWQKGERKGFFKSSFTNPGHRSLRRTLVLLVQCGTMKKFKRVQNPEVSDTTKAILKHESWYQNNNRNGQWNTSSEK